MRLNVNKNRGTRYTNGLVVDYVPAGLEIEEHSIVSGRTIHRRDCQGGYAAAMQGAHIKHMEFRDDRFVVLPPAWKAT